MKNDVTFYPKLKIELLHDPAILLLGIFSKELKARAPRDICTSVFIVSLMTVAKREKQTASYFKNIFIRV